MGEKEREAISFPEEYVTADGTRWSGSDSVRFSLVVLRCRILSTTMNQFIDLLVLFVILYGLVRSMICRGTVQEAR